MATTQRISNAGDIILYAGDQRIGTAQRLTVTPSYEELPNRNGTIYPSYITEANDLSEEQMRTMLSRMHDSTAVLIEGSFASVETIGHVHGTQIDKAFKSVKMGKPKTNREAVRFLEKE